MMADKDKSEPSSWFRYIVAPLTVVAVGGIITAASGWGLIWAAIVWIFVALWACIVWFFAGWVSVPPWLLALLIIGTLFAIVFVVASVRAASTDIAPFRSYTEDVILGVKWKWHWNQSGNAVNLTPYCPQCDFQLVPSVSRAIERYPFTNFECEECQRMLKTFDQHQDEVMDLIHRKIIHQAKKLEATQGEPPNAR
jgi:hypothetical protein